MRIRQGIITTLITVVGIAGAYQISVAQEEEVSPAEPQSEGMTQAEMASIIGDIAGEYQGSPNNIQFEIDGTPMMLVSDERANRMRLLSPIVPADALSQENLIATLISNYHLALDARYAVGNGILYSAYIHPLKELTRAQLESAVRQVTNLRNTFGTSYSSGELSFGAQSAPEGEEI